jgi:hypothetical protein
VSQAWGAATSVDRNKGEGVLFTRAVRGSSGCRGKCWGYRKGRASRSRSGNRRTGSGGTQAYNRGGGRYGRCRRCRWCGRGSSNCRGDRRSRWLAQRRVDPNSVGERGPRGRRAARVSAGGPAGGSQLGTNDNRGPEGIEISVGVNHKDISGCRAAVWAAAAPGSGPAVQVATVVELCGWKSSSPEGFREQAPEVRCRHRGKAFGSLGKEGRHLNSRVEERGGTIALGVVGVDVRRWGHGTLSLPQSKGCVPRTVPTPPVGRLKGHSKVGESVRNSHVVSAPPGDADAREVGCELAGMSVQREKRRTGNAVRS